MGARGMENITNSTLNGSLNATADAAAAGSLTFVYATLLLTAPTLVYYGSKRSIESVEKETMTTKDAMMFPVVGSCVLFGLFLVFKFFAKEYINMLLHFYFIFLGAVCIATTVHPWLVRIMGEDTTKKLFSLNLKIPFYHTEAVPVDATSTEALAYFVGSIGAVWYGITKHWLANNLIGACFCVQGIEMMSLGSVLNGVILLIGLFFPKSLPTVAGQFSILGHGERCQEF